MTEEAIIMLVTIVLAFLCATTIIGCGYTGYIIGLNTMNKKWLQWDYERGTDLPMETTLLLTRIETLANWQNEVKSVCYNLYVGGDDNEFATLLELVDLELEGVNDDYQG